MPLSRLATTPSTVAPAASSECRTTARWSRRAIPALATTMAPAHMAARIDGSVTGSEGGLSTTTTSYSASSERRTFSMAAEPSSSLGFGGTSPEAMKSTLPLGPHTCTTSRTSARPMSTVVSPTEPSVRR